MEKINVKILAIVLLIIATLCIGIFVVVKLVNSNSDKSYKLEKITENDYQYFVALTNNQYTVIDRNGNMVVQDKYEKITIPNPTKAVFLVVDSDGNNKVLNQNGELIFTEYNNVQAIEVNGTMTNLPYEKSVLKFEEDGKYGLIDFSGNVIVKAIYEEISSVKYKEGEILAKKNGKYGVINNKGIELIPFEYDEIEADKYYIDNGYSKSGYIVKNTTKEGYRYGYIDSNWKVLLETEYTNISRILNIESDDIYLIVAKNGQYGVVKNKNVEIDFLYQAIEYNKDTNLFQVERSEQYGVVDENGKIIVDIEYKSIQFNGVYILAKAYTENTYFNAKGEKVEEDYISMIKAPEIKSYITIDKNNLYGIIDEKGKKVVPNEYLYIEYAFDKYFIAYKDGKGLGVVDNDGNVCVEFEYDVLSKVGEYKLLKGIDMENNVIDIFSKDMKKITTLSNAVVEIHDTYIEIYNNKSTKFVNENGELKEAKEILKDNKLFAFFKNEKWGFEDKDGNIKVEPSYDYVTEFNKFGFAGIRKDNKWGVIDQEGNIVCECKFEFEQEEEDVKPEFIGKYYKAYTENNEMYYTDEI